MPHLLKNISHSSLGSNLRVRTILKLGYPRSETNDLLILSFSSSLLLPASSGRCALVKDSTAYRKPQIIVLQVTLMSGISQYQPCSQVLTQLAEFLGLEQWKGGWTRASEQGSVNVPDFSLAPRLLLSFLVTTVKQERSLEVRLPALPLVLYRRFDS